jgi:hypothetical protein
MTEACVIGDQIRRPAAWCDTAGVHGGVPGSGCPGGGGQPGPGGGRGSASGCLGPAGAPGPGVRMPGAGWCARPAGRLPGVTRRRAPGPRAGAGHGPGPPIRPVMSRGRSPPVSPGRHRRVWQPRQPAQRRGPRAFMRVLSRAARCLRDFKTRLPPLTCGFVTSSVGLYAAFLYSLISPPRTRCRRTFPSLGPATEAGSISSGRGRRRSRARCGRCWL